jgi:hypothetical protein
MKISGEWFGILKRASAESSEIYLNYNPGVIKFSPLIFLSPSEPDKWYRRSGMAF